MVFVWYVLSFIYSSVFVVGGGLQVRCSGLCEVGRFFLYIVEALQLNTSVSLRLCCVAA